LQRTIPSLRALQLAAYIGSFMGLPATDKLITMTGIEIFRIKDGKIHELWGEANLPGLMQQPGIVSVPGNEG